jgi:hypothetical protein
MKLGAHRKRLTEQTNRLLNHWTGSENDLRGFDTIAVVQHDCGHSMPITLDADDRTVNEHDACRSRFAE